MEEKGKGFVGKFSSIIVCQNHIPFFLNKIKILGARMSILDSDDDADMEQSLTEQRNLQQRLEERNLQQSLEERHNLEEQQQSLEESHSLADDQPRGRIVDVPLSAIQSLGKALVLPGREGDIGLFV